MALGDIQYVSTPNDYALQVENLRGGTMTYGVCKWVCDGGPYKVWSASQTSDGHTHWERDLARFGSYSEACAEAQAKAEWFSGMVRSYSKSQPSS